MMIKGYPRARIIRSWTLESPRRPRPSALIGFWHVLFGIALGAAIAVALYECRKAQPPVPEFRGAVEFRPEPEARPARTWLL